MVDEAAVIAFPDEKWGEVPLAFVTLRHDVSVPPTGENVHRPYITPHCIVCKVHVQRPWRCHHLEYSTKRMHHPQDSIDTLPLIVAIVPYYLELSTDY